jgi:3',5'-cyclic AMP phosphodiesterase CpdA
MKHNLTLFANRPRCITRKYAISLLFIFPLLILVLSFSLAPGNGLGKDAPSVTFAHITDVHYNPQRDNVKGRMVKHSKELLDDAIDQINGMNGIDFVAFTGDLADRADEKLLTQFAREANRLKVPWMWTTGNHDLAPDGVHRAKFLSIMNANNAYIKPQTTCYSFSVRGFLFFAMDGASDSETTSKGSFSRDCLAVLEKGLNDNPGAPAAIFQHFPIVYPFQSASHGVKNQEEYLRIIGAHPNLKALFSGHFHAAKIQNRNNMLHVSTPALVEYPNSFRIVNVAQTGNGLVFDIKLVQTHLKSVREQSRKRAGSPALNEGKEGDRNARVILK